MSTGKIRVEIDDFDELYAVDELKKPVKIGNVEWTFGAFSETSPRTSNVRHLGVVLHCNKASRSNQWHVEATVDFKLCKLGAPELMGATSGPIHFSAHSNQKTLEIPNFRNFQEVLSVENGYVSDNTVVMEATIRVDSTRGIHEFERILETFDAPKAHLTDVVLVVEGKKCHVAKKVLAEQSEHFFEMFFGNNGQKASPSESSLETTPEEFIIDDVKHSEFIDFLNLIYGNVEINDHSLLAILKLAHRFQCPWIVQKCEQFLIYSSSSMHCVEKLKLAEVYTLAALQNSCLSQLTTTEGILKLAEHKSHKELSSITSEALFQRIAEISKTAKIDADEKSEKKSEKIPEKNGEENAENTETEA